MYARPDRQQQPSYFYCLKPRAPFDLVGIDANWHSLLSPGQLRVCHLVAHQDRVRVEVDLDELAAPQAVAFA